MTYLTRSDIAALRNLHVVRANNDLFVKLLDSYSNLTRENIIYKSRNAELENQIEATTNENFTMYKELEFLRTYSRKIENKNEFLVKNLQKFVKGLKAAEVITDENEDDGFYYDTGI